MRGAKPERALEHYVERAGIVRRGERLVVACSGGPDSVALAGVMHSLRETLDLTLTLAYVNHGTRHSAWQDECVVLRLAAMLQLPVKTVSLQFAEPAASVPGRYPGDGPAAQGAGEAALREARYEELVKIAYEDDAGGIVTAHHAEDQSETVLLALFRGAGLKGLSGMPPRRRMEGFGVREGAPVELLRPLLRIPSTDLREYCHLQGLPYAVDPTNADQEIRRNAVRSVLERLRPLFPGLDRAIARSASKVTETTFSGKMSQ